MANCGYDKRKLNYSCIRTAKPASDLLKRRQGKKRCLPICDDKNSYLLTADFAEN